ncbi:MAG: hypothetical protein ACK56I_14355, partial [bacterium]
LLSAPGAALRRGPVRKAVDRPRRRDLQAAMWCRRRKPAAPDRRQQLPWLARHPRGWFRGGRWPISAARFRR